MLNAARAHGMPTMVIAMMTEAISQPAAIHRPPKAIHNTLSSSANSDIADPRRRRNVVVALVNRQRSNGDCEDHSPEVGVQPATSWANVRFRHTAPGSSVRPI